MIRTVLLTLACWTMLLGSPVVAQVADFNGYIVDAVNKIYAERRGGGYDIGSFFTQDLRWGTDPSDEDSIIHANNPPLTMCVAAIM